MNVKNNVQISIAAFAAALIVLAGCQKKEEPAPTPAARPAKPAIVSAEKNSFAEVTAKLDPGGNFFLYLSTEQILSGLSSNLNSASNFVSALPNLPGTGRQTLDKVFAVLSGVVHDSGISQISGLGMSSIAREPGFYYNKVIIHHYPGQNTGLIWSLLGKSPHPLKVLDMLPESTALAGSSDFDLSLTWTNIVDTVQTLAIPELSKGMDEVPAKFLQATGLDLNAALNSLGGEYGLVLTLDTNKTVSLPLGDKPIVIPNPALCLIFKVNSDLIFDRVDKILNDNPILGKMVFKTDDPGFKMRTVPVPLPIPVEVRPSMARVGDYLLVASTDTIIREMVAVQTGKKNGFKSTEEFKRLSQGVPTEGNNFSLATPALGKTIGKIQESAMANQNLDEEALKPFRQMIERGAAAGSYSVGLNGPDGWEGIGNGGGQGAQMVIVPAAFAVGGLAAILYPNVVQARTTAQKSFCISNLRNIELAKKLWAEDNKKQSTDTPTMQDLQPFFGGANGKPPVCPTGGVYTIGAVNEKATCSVAGHVLP